MAFGLDSTGVTVPAFSEVREEIVAALKDKLGTGINTNSDSVFGIFCDIMAERELDLWQFGEAIYSSQYVEASGVSLDRVANLTGVARLPATQSTNTATLSGTPGTVIPANRRISIDSTGKILTTDSEVTIGGGGTVGVGVTAEETGAIAILSADTYTIETPVFGWSTVTFGADGEEGRDIETDSALRTRREALLRALGSATDDAIAARLLEVTGVTAAIVISNRSNFADADLRPGKSFEAVVLGGADADIWQAIWDHAPSGIEYLGTEVGNATDIRGNTREVKFNRPSAIQIFASVTGTKDADYPVDGDVQIINQIVAYGGTLSIGDDVEYLQILAQIIQNIPGLLTLTVEVGTTAPGVAEANVVIEETEIASIGGLDISVSIV